VNSCYIILLSGSYFVIVYYLPIYFQSIDDVNPTQSGVRNLPLILAVTFATILSGGSISQNGHAVPLLVGGAAIATIGSGLIYTLDIGSSTGRWIGFQILAGVGYGLSFQVPMIMVQATSPPEDLAASTAIIMFFQTMGGAIFVAAGQSAFVNTMIKQLASSAPTVSAGQVILTGATEIRNVFAPDQVPGILVAYMAGLKVAFALSIAGTGIAFLFSVANSWRRLNPEAITGGGAA